MRTGRALRRYGAKLLCAGLAAVVLSLAPGCSQQKEPCTPQPGGADPFASLDRWCMVSLREGEIVPEVGVLPYDLNTPLFSDGAVKRRTVWLPTGVGAPYDPKAVFDFPDGTVFTKSFGFPDDLRKAQPSILWIETRVEWRAQGTWQAVSYRWDDTQTQAVAVPGGAFATPSWIDAQGETQTAHYRVPDRVQCKQCHQDGSELVPLGPTARNLNRSYAYDGGPENQLAHWSGAGLLVGAPTPEVAPRLASWNDPGTGTVDERARAYLEVNCAHCHHVGGTAQSVGLVLEADETDPYRVGVCKVPSVSGPATGGKPYDVVPGDPDGSAMAFRITSTSRVAAMPQIERSVVDTDGVALIRAWIAGLPGHCP